MEYTVNELAMAAGISVRTLHYYDEIGLLKPSFVRENGYRVYAQKELLLLQQILFFRELEFPLDEITKIVNEPGFDSLQALTDQKKMLELKKERVEALLKTIEKTIMNVKGGETMSVTDMYGNFTKKQMEEYQKEAKERWGHTDAWKQSQERTKNWTKEDYTRIQEAGIVWTKKLAQMREQGLTPDSDEIQAMIAEHYNGLRTFYEPNYEMYKGLGQMYDDDPRFTMYYDKHGDGLAEFMRDAMIIFADTKLSK
ncbi:MerR family transcriptional regulator [soil metagenome]